MQRTVGWKSVNKKTWWAIFYTIHRQSASSLSRVGIGSCSKKVLRFSILVSNGQASLANNIHSNGLQLPPLNMSGHKLLM